MNYDPSEVKKLREQHVLLQAEVARMREAMTMILSLMGDCGTERCTLVPKAKEIAAKALARDREIGEGRMSCGTTHYQGCECNERAHAREIAALEAEVARLKEDYQGAMNCSGWKQGFERGQGMIELELGEYKRALRDAHDKIEALQADHIADLQLMSAQADQVELLQAEVARLREALIAIFNTDHTRGCPEGTCNCHKQVAWDALQQMPVQTESKVGE